MAAKACARRRGKVNWPEGASGVGLGHLFSINRCSGLFEL